MSAKPEWVAPHVDPTAEQIAKMSRWVVRPGHVCDDCARGLHGHESTIMWIARDRRCPCEGDCGVNSPSWGRALGRSEREREDERQRYRAQYGLG